MDNVRANILPVPPMIASTAWDYLIPMPPEMETAMLYKVLDGHYLLTGGARVYLMRNPGLKEKLLAMPWIQGRIAEKWDVQCQYRAKIQKYLAEQQFIA